MSCQEEKQWSGDEAAALVADTGEEALVVFDHIFEVPVVIKYVYNSFRCIYNQENYSEIV